MRTLTFCSLFAFCCPFHSKCSNEGLKVDAANPDVGRVNTTRESGGRLRLVPSYKTVNVAKYMGRERPVMGPLQLVRF